MLANLGVAPNGTRVLKVSIHWLLTALSSSALEN
jgi:hypothetical protein